jgi:hypothetical protein
VIVAVAGVIVGVADVIFCAADVIFSTKVQASCLPNRPFASKSPILTNETAICVGKYDVFGCGPFQRANIPGVCGKRRISGIAARPCARHFS